METDEFDNVSFAMTTDAMPVGSREFFLLQHLFRPRKSLPARSPVVLS